MSELGEVLREDFKDKEYRRVYCDEFLNASIATQIKALREQRGMTQAELADLAGMKQPRIAVLEDVDYSRWSVSTLRKLAMAFDLTLSVEFRSFGETLHEILKFCRDSLERPSFDEDPTFHVLTNAHDEPLMTSAALGDASATALNEPLASIFSLPGTLDSGSAISGTDSALPSDSESDCTACRVNGR